MNSVISNCEIGRKIKYRRTEQSLTQEMLAALLDVSYQQIQRYESGKDRLNVEKLQAVAHALSVPVSYFFHPLGYEEFLLGDQSEHELIINYRKAQRNEVKTLIVDFAIMVARWENGSKGT